MTMTTGTEIHPTIRATTRTTRGEAHMALSTARKVKLKQTPELIRKRQTFESGKLRATLGPAGVYTVWSYHTAIAGQADGGPWWISSTPASITTSEHLRMVRRALKDVEAVSARA